MTAELCLDVGFDLTLPLTILTGLFIISEDKVLTQILEWQLLNVSWDDSSFWKTSPT